MSVSIVDEAERSKPVRNFPGNWDQYITDPRVLGRHACAEANVLLNVAGNIEEGRGWHRRGLAVHERLHDAPRAHVLRHVHIIKSVAPTTPLYRTATLGDTHTHTHTHTLFASHIVHS